MKSRAKIAVGFALLAGLALVGTGAQAGGKDRPIPNDLALLKSLKKSWEGLSCKGELAMSLAGLATPLVTAPLALAYAKDTLDWVAFIVPPTPCSGTVILGGIKVGPGNKPALRMGVPPGLILGNAPATLTWKQLEAKDGAHTQNLSAGALCGPQASSDNTDALFAGFTGGLRQRPDARSWDSEIPALLKLEGGIDASEAEKLGRYTVWLDSSRGYLPVKTERKLSLSGAVTRSTFEPKEVSPGRWLPVRWETTQPGKPSLVGEFRNLKCDVPIPPEWFKTSTFPDLASEKPVLEALRAL